MDKKERFFGLHFDYHANKFTKGIGRDFDPAILRKIIEEVKPDFIQCDTKGHPGYTSYKTKIGYPAPGLEKDLLKMWREVTSEYGVPLYSHYSGIWDMKATSAHPEWASVNAKGERWDRISIFGEYPDKILIPELKELIGDYAIDGAWVDGECWALTVDYSPMAKEAYRKETGKEVPLPEEEGFADYLKFTRKSFFDYVRHYVDEVHKAKPDFMITSNWMNTAWVPDNVAFTDYISGDLSPTNSVDSARFDGRLMAMSGRNWDIMSWGINFPVHHTKGVVQLEQEAACVLALGGGFQIYNMQDPTNVCMNPAAIPNWAEVSKFCHDRKEYCFGGEFVPDMGILYSVDSYYDCISAPFWRDCAYHNELYGTMLGILDQGTSLNVVSEQGLTLEKLKDYPRFAVSDATALSKEVVKMLLEYASIGGELILIGAHTAKTFADALGLESEVKEGKHPICFYASGKGDLEVRDAYALLKGKGLETKLSMYPAIIEGDVDCTNPPPTVLKGMDAYPGLAFYAYQKGKILFVPINLGLAYLKERTIEAENVFSFLCASSRRLISHNQAGDMEVVLRKKDGHTYLHLINLLGNHRVPRFSSFDKIPSLREVEVSVKFDKEPAHAYLEPNHQEIPFSYKNGEVVLNFEKLPVYEIVSFEF